MEPPTSTAAAPPAAELVFGRYQIIRRLAVGGMGEVFLARQTGVAGFDRLVILKSLLPDLAAQEDFVQQFLDEARVAATLNHQNIVSIFEVGLWAGTYFIAMEYIRGDNLSRLLRVAERKSLAVPVDVATQIAHDAAAALYHAHHARALDGTPLSIVHRDVSPQNIMVRLDGVTKVVDFGIAKAANRSARTATGLLKGKIQYMAPEQVQAGDVDARADQFALGVVLWELLAGRKLWNGASDIENLRAVLDAPIPRVETLRPEVPPALAACVHRMLERNRDARFADLNAAAGALRAVLERNGPSQAQRDTADYVTTLLGTEVDGKTMDLTPSSAQNFVINLAGGAGTGTPFTTVTAMKQRARSRGLAIGLALVVVTGGAVTAAVMASGALVDAAPDAAPAVAVQAPPPLAPARASPVLPASGRYSISSDPAGAEVFEGDARLGVTPLALDSVVPDVVHTYRIALPGYASETVTATLHPGEALRERITLVRDKRAAPPRASTAAAAGSDSAPAARPQNGMLSLSTTPWAKVYIDGSYVDSTPIANYAIAPGKHTVKLVNEAKGVSVTRTLQVAPGQRLRENWTLAP